nr:iron-containing alcohol dehydrogenase [uncultured Cohaesibacter sp.]
MEFRSIQPQKIFHGKEALNHLPEILKTFHTKAPLVVTDQTMTALGITKKVKGILTSAGFCVDVFDRCEQEPTAASLTVGIEQILERQNDLIIALGGGSPIDSAKAMAQVAHFGGAISDYKFPRDVSEPGLPLIAIPTTAGTGSEVTRSSVITDEKTDEKMLCIGDGFVPTIAIVDFSLTMTVPARVTADSGLDALTHALEAYVSRKANPYSDAMALAALKLIAPNLRTVYTEPANEAAREAIMTGAHFAGLAFSNASVALVHGMSRPIGANFHVPHGMSNAMLLPAVTRFSVPHAKDRYAEASRAMAVASHLDSTNEACNRLLVELDLLNQDLHVPTIEAFGIAPQEFRSLLPTMAKQALASGSPANNPVVPSATDIVQIYDELLA